VVYFFILFIVDCEINKKVGGIKLKTYIDTGTKLDQLSRKRQQYILFLVVV